jgi:hypothetical protein
MKITYQVTLILLMAIFSVNSNPTILTQNIESSIEELSKTLISKLSNKGTKLLFLSDSLENKNEQALQNLLCTQTRIKLQKDLTIKILNRDLLKEALSEDTLTMKGVFKETALQSIGNLYKANKILKCSTIVTNGNGIFVTEVIDPSTMESEIFQAKLESGFDLDPKLLTLLDKEKEKIKVLEKEKETLKSYYDSELKNLNKKYEEKEKIIRESILQEEQIKTKKLRDLDEEIRKKSEILSSYEKDLKIMEKKITEIDSSSNNIQYRISEIKKIISQKTDIALNNIQIGMTHDEMIEVAGKYRSKDIIFNRYNYGNVWVNIEEGLVKCLVKSECPRYSCSSYRYSDEHCILKK